MTDRQNAETLAAGLVARPSKSAPDEVIWGCPPDERWLASLDRIHSEPQSASQAPGVPGQGPDVFRPSETSSERTSA